MKVLTPHADMPAGRGNWLFVGGVQQLKLKVVCGGTHLHQWLLPPAAQASVYAVRRCCGSRRLRHMLIGRSWPGHHDAINETLALIPSGRLELSAQHCLR